MSAEHHFDFKFSLPPPHDGPLVELSHKEAEELLLKNLREAADPMEPLWQLARFYSHLKAHEKALKCLHQVMELKDDLEHKAHCVLAMGQAMEQIGDYVSAVRYYREAIALEPVNTPTWYFINNNLGFSLNTLGQFEEGERFCRTAIAIDRKRPNAFKNLGVALQGQHQLAAAARCFIEATQADASDPRSVKLLENLLAQHPELNLAEDLECCQEAIRVAQERRQILQPVIHRGWRKQFVLGAQRITSWFKGLRH